MDRQAPEGHAGRYKWFASQQKLEILREWERDGNVTEVAWKYGIPPSRLYRWKKQLEHGADEFLRGGRPKKQAEIRELEQEIRNLKDTIAIQARELISRAGAGTCWCYWTCSAA